MADRTKTETGSEQRIPDDAKQSQEKSRAPSIGYSADVERNEQFDATVATRDAIKGDDRMRDAQRAATGNRRDEMDQLSDSGFPKDTLDPESVNEKGLKNPNSRNTGLDSDR